MTHLADIPAGAAVVIALLLILGASLTLTGSLGVLILRNFYQRLHAPTLGTSWGTGAIALASLVTFSFLRGSPSLHEVVIGVFIMITTPIGLLLLGRAACRRHVGPYGPLSESCSPMQSPASEAPPETETRAADDKADDKADDTANGTAATAARETAARPANPPRPAG